MSADMYMIRQLEIQTTAFSLAHLLKIFQMVGYARFAEWELKTSLR